MPTDETICYTLHMSDDTAPDRIPLKWQPLVFGGGGFLVGFLSFGAFILYIINR